MDLRWVVIEPIHGTERHADLVLIQRRTSGGAALSCSKERVKLVITGSSLSAFAREHRYFERYGRALIRVNQSPEPTARSSR